MRADAGNPRAATRVSSPMFTEGSVPLRGAPPLVVQAAAATDRGRVRDHNEDRVHCDPERGIFVVVDGLGGHAGGETAAETAILQVRARLERQSGSPEERLREAITLANNEVWRLAGTNPAWEGMACVLTAAVLEGDQLTVGHVGDSRLYQLDVTSIRKLTRDHSPVGEREDAGELDEQAAMRHPRRNEVYRDVGSQRHAPGDPDFIDIVRATVPDESALVLCSDGLSDLVPAREIHEVVRRNAGHPRAVAELLVARANDAGGKDNVSVIYVEGPRFAKATLAAPESSTNGRLLPRVANPVAGWRGRSVALACALGGLLGMAAAAAVLVWSPAELSPWLGPLTASRGERTLIVRQASAAPFASIASALESASWGDTVLVGAGEYREQVRLRSGVAVVAEELHRVVLRLPEAAAEGAAVIAVAVDRAALRGVQIGGGAERLDYGVLIRSASVELEDLRVSGAVIAGVEIAGAGAVALRASDISDNLGVGVRVGAGAAPQVLHNTIARNGGAPAGGAGVHVHADAAPILLGNVIIGNSGEGVAGVPADLRATILRNNMFLPATGRNGGGPLGPASSGTPR